MVDPPQSHSPLRREEPVNWLLRQLKDAPGNTRIDCYGARSRTSSSELISVARERIEVLLPADGREPSSFEVSSFRPMGVKRGAGRNSFVASVVDAVDEFYRDVVQGLRAWTPSAPKLERRPDDTAPLQSVPDQPVTRQLEVQPVVARPVFPSWPQSS